MSRNLRKYAWADTSTGDGGSGHTHDPQSFTLTRDVNERVETIAIVGGATWTLSRNPNQSIASLTDTVHLVTIDRAGNGVLTGATVTDV